MSKGTNAERKQAAALKRGVETVGDGREAADAEEQAAAPSDAEVLGFSALTFRRRLGAWYRENARALPWRGVGDPYATWLSEIMLQQTGVKTVAPYYVKFLAKWPTVEALAALEGLPAHAEAVQR